MRQPESRAQPIRMIPRTLHFIWIGDAAQRPDALMQTWWHHHPGWEILLWGNDDLDGRDWRFSDLMRRWAGRDLRVVADLMRWEILLEKGGVCVAADSVCVRPLDDLLLTATAFACAVDDRRQPGLLSAAYVGCAAGDPLLAHLVRGIGDASPAAQDDASQLAGAHRLTRSWRASACCELQVLPSESFIPFHPGRAAQPWRQPPYACELWAGRQGLTSQLHRIDPASIAELLVAA
jgi:hypothetical protein